MRNILRDNKMQTRSQTAKNRDAQQNKPPRDFPQQENETERIKDRFIERRRRCKK